MAEVIAFSALQPPSPEQVWDEYGPYVERPDTELLAWGSRVGILPRHMKGMAELTSGIVVTEAARRFVIDPPNEAIAVHRAVHLPIFDDDGALVEMVRFRKESPSAKLHGGRVCRTLDYVGAPAKGEDAAGFPNPTHIHRNVVGWLRAGRRGMVYLRGGWQSFRLDWLRALPAVVGDDLEHTQFLQNVAWSGFEKDRPARWGRVTSRDFPAMQRKARAIAERQRH